MIIVQGVHPIVFRLIGFLLILFGISTFAQETSKGKTAAASTAEQRTARALETAKANPLELHAFLVGMPKGADLTIT